MGDSKTKATIDKKSITAIADQVEAQLRQTPVGTSAAVRDPNVENFQCKKRAKRYQEDLLLGCCIRSRCCLRRAAYG